MLGLKLIHISEKSPWWSLKTRSYQDAKFVIIDNTVGGSLRLWQPADLGLRPANERRRYFVTTSLIGWVQASTDKLRYHHDNSPTWILYEGMLYERLC